MKLSRRSALKLTAFGLGAITLDAVTNAWVPKRLLQSTRAQTGLPAIQFDIGDFIAPAQTIDGIEFRFGPVFTSLITARLTRKPDANDQQVLSDALSAIESAYPFSPQGLFTIVSYGLPYFRRLPQALVTAHMPRLRSNPGRYALAEAVPSPTDVSRRNPSIIKETFNVPVAIEQNDVLFTMRSDTLAPLLDVYSWLNGADWLNGTFTAAPAFNDLLKFTSNRLMFAQRGLPRKIAEAHQLPFAGRIHPESPMWMGFADQQTKGSGPASIVTFQGNDEARFTDTQTGDYFFNGSIQHLSHVILDLGKWYEEKYAERVQYMFRSNPIPAQSNADEFADGGGPAFIETKFVSRQDAEDNARGIGTSENEHRMGHLTALHRSSRTSSGTATHIRMDGPGFDSMDVPDGTSQPKLQFTAFIPTADFFATMRRNQAAVDLVRRHDVDEEDNGLERFLTATRRQNFLVPPREHRAFPLVELA
jgi:hypothetical protein